MSNFYVSSVGWTAVTAWATGAKLLGAYCRQSATPTVGQERVFKCTTAGASGVSEPSPWTLTNGGTTTDGTVVWTEVTGKESEQSAANWTAPAARLNAFPSGRLGNGDYLYVSQDHDETSSAATTMPASAIAVNPLYIICVNRGVGSSLPPVTADLATTGIVETSSTALLTIGGGSNVSTNIYGLNFKAGSAGNNASLSINAGTGIGGVISLDTCTLTLNNSNSSARLNIGTTGGANVGWPTVRLKNTTMTFGSASQTVITAATNVEWTNTASAILGTVPTSLFTINTGAYGGTFVCRGVDLSGIAGNLFTGAAGGPMQFTLANCQLNSAVTVSATAPPFNSSSGISGFLRVDNSDDSVSGKNYRFAWFVWGGSAVQDTSVIRTGGASDGVTALSWKVTTSSVTGLSLANQAILPAIVKRDNATGSGVTATVCFVANAASALTNAQIWMEVEALTTSGVPLSTFSDDRVANLLGSTSASGQPTDTSAWDTGATARANNHAYSVNDVFQVTATNPGRIFIVTVAGTSATSQPAAYATAVDGDSITTDRNGGSMTVRCMVRQSLAVPFTPRVAGIVRATVKMAVASQTCWIDPLLTIA